MNWKKLLSINNGLSSLRNPSGRVTHVVFLCFLLSLLFFYVIIPACSNSPPSSLSSFGVPSLLKWFSSFSNPPQKAHVDFGSVEIGNSTKTKAQATTGDLVKKDEILGATHNESSSLLGGEAILETMNKTTVEVGRVKNATEVNGTNHESAVHSAVELNRAESEGLSIGGSNGTGSYEHVSFEECDIFDGKWVRDERKPFYTSASCPYIDLGFNCHANGRPDYDFLKWRWQPNRCNIPRMNATDFLERLRGQRLVFVGDSLNRNMWESMVCTLRQSVANKKRVFEVSGSTQFKTRGYFSFKFKDHNCSVEYVRAPFLVKEMYIRQGNGAVIPRIRLDMLEDSASTYHEADIIVFNTAHWWTHEKTAKGIDYYQVRNHVYPVLPLMDAYRKGLKTWASWVDRNINSEKTQVFFRGVSLTHYRGGRWNSGGHCHNQTEPIFNETFLDEYPPMMFTVEKILKKMKTPVTYLNISKLTDYRKDGHPSIYRKKHNSVEEQIAYLRLQDCSHWCLPGIPDAWNELLYASLLKIGRGPWRI